MTWMRLCHFLRYRPAILEFPINGHTHSRTHTNITFIVVKDACIQNGRGRFCEIIKLDFGSLFPLNTNATSDNPFHGHQVLCVNQQRIERGLP